METYRVDSSSNKKVFTITQNNKLIGDLKYNDWFSFQSEILLPNKSKYQIEQSSFWCSSYELKEDGVLLLYFKTLDDCSIKIYTGFDNIYQDFIFKPSYIFNNLFVLSDKEGNELLEVYPDIKWNKFHYDYNIVSSNAFEKLEYKDLLLLTITHCVNYNMTLVENTVLISVF